jgi:hypothetical protein
MKSPVKQYTNELYRKFNYYATWMPGTPMELGTVGIMDGKEFVKKSHLRNFGIAFETEEDPSKDDLDYTSDSGVTFAPKASGTIPSAGSVLTQADAGFTVDFSREKAILFKVKGARYVSISDQEKLGRDIARLKKEGKWKKEYVVIVELVMADSATILISGSANSKIELKANANIGATKLDIADASLQLGIAVAKSMSTKIIAEQGLTPLFRIRRTRG